MNFDFKKEIVFWLIPFVFIGLWYFKEIIFPFLIGIILGLAVQTFSLFLNYKLKINYYLNVFLIYSLLIVFLSLIFYFIFQVLSDQIPDLYLKLKPYLKEFNLEKFVFFKNWENILTFGNYFPNIFILVKNLFGGIISLILIFVVSLYVALDKNFPQSIFNLFEEKEKYALFWRRIKRKISFWLFGQFVLMIFIGLMTYIFFGPILKIKYAPILGLVAGIFEIIPLLGPALTLFLASALTFLEKPDLVIFVIAYFLFLQQVENHLLVPLVMKRAISLHPLLIILGVLIGGKIGGILGIIIILPLLGVISEIFKIAGSSNGRTSGSGPESSGSNPDPAD